MRICTGLNEAILQCTYSLGNLFIRQLGAHNLSSALIPLYVYYVIYNTLIISVNDSLQSKVIVVPAISP